MLLTAASWDGSKEQWQTDNVGSLGPSLEFCSMMNPAVGLHSGLDGLRASGASDCDSWGASDIDFLMHCLMDCLYAKYYVCLGSCMKVILMYIWILKAY